MSKRGCRSSFTLFGVLLLAAALTLLLSSAAVSAQSSKIKYVDPSPPSGWYQCAGFINTAGNDIDSSFADDCQYSDGLRIRVWDSAGILEDDVYATGLPKVTEWPKSGSLGTAEVKVKSTYWTAAGTFLTSADGLSSAKYTNQQGATEQMCLGGASQNGGLTISSGSPSSAIIAAGNTGYDEYIANCGYNGYELNKEGDYVYSPHSSTPLPDRKIAVYVNRQGPPDLCAKFADDLSKDKGCCVAKGFKWLKSGETPAAATTPAQVIDPSEDRSSLAVAYSTSENQPASWFWHTIGGPVSKLYLARSNDGGTTWQSNSLIMSTVPMKGGAGQPTYASVSGSSASDVDLVYVGIQQQANEYKRVLTFNSVDRGVSSTIDISPPFTDSGSVDTTSTFFSNPSLKVLDRDNLFVSYTVAKPAFSLTYLKFASSTDGGKTWAEASGSGKYPSGTFPSVTANTAGSAYVGIDGLLKFAKSTVDTSATALQAVTSVVGSNQVYIAYTTSVSNNIIVARSYDGGATWSMNAIGSALPPQSISLYVAAKAGKSYADPEFKDSNGERKAAEGVKLLPGKEGCSSNFGIARARECAAGACTSSPNDAALCDKASDCVYNGKCYSDIKSVAATFFSNELKGVWNSAWRPEVSADINGDGKIEVCDPGQWQSPTGTVVGTVTDLTTSAPLGSATVDMVGTPPNQGTTFAATTAADGTYTINNVNALTYDMTASASGYGIQVKANQPIQPFQTNTIDFQLTQAGAGGVWGGGTATISGTVTNITGQPVAGAAVKVLGTSFTAATAADGTYTIAGVPSGAYDISAGKPGDGYSDATALGVNVVSGPTTVDFTLLLSLGSCTNDCSKVGSSACDASCDGKGACRFYSTETKQACDGTFGIIDMTGGRQVSCCKGQPYTPQKADVVVKAKQIVKTVKPVLYQGKLVNLVTLLFIPDRQS